jgi:hypothetical protein
MERFCSFGSRKGYRSSHLTGLLTLEDMHICSENPLFTKLMFFEYQIEAADYSSSMKMPGGGSYIISVAGEDRSVNYLDFAEVLYVPDATCKLVPLSGV